MGGGYFESEFREWFKKKKRVRKINRKTPPLPASKKAEMWKKKKINDVMRTHQGCRERGGRKKKSPPPKKKLTFFEMCTTPPLFPYPTPPKQQSPTNHHPPTQRTRTILGHNLHKEIPISDQTTHIVPPIFQTNRLEYTPARPRKGKELKKTPKTPSVFPLNF